MNNTEFIKIDDIIIPKPIGADYNMESGKIYNLNYNRMSGEVYMELSDVTLSIPKKVFYLKKDLSFKDRILTYFDNTNKHTTGVMLAGVKGTGKTLCAKIIAIESKLPIVIVSESVPAAKLTTYFDKIKETPMCLLFDEVEKKWNTEEMLTFLDGLSDNSKKLIILTCNNLNRVSEYMQDRCSRIRYLRKYTDTENIELINQILEYNDISGDEANDVSFYIKNYMELLSIDNICSFIEEYKIFKEKYTLDDIFEYMNLTKTDRKFTKETVDNEKIKSNSEEKAKSKAIDLKNAIEILSTEYSTMPSTIKKVLENEIKYYDD